MAINEVNEYAVDNTNIVKLQETVDKQRYGFQQVSLTEMTTTTVPAIAGGSKFENNGSLWEVTSDAAISGSPSDGTIYIVFDPTGPSFSFSNTFGTWSDSKQGYYGTGGSVNNRYLMWDVEKISASYTEQRLLIANNNDSRIHFIGPVSLAYSNFTYDSTLRTPGTSGATEPNTVTTSADLLPGRFYEICCQGTVDMASGPATTVNAHLGFSKVSGSASIELSHLSPSDSNGDDEFVGNTISISNNPATAEFPFAIKALVYCTTPGTAVFGLFWSKSGTGTVTSSTRRIFFTGLGITE